MELPLPARQGSTLGPTPSKPNHRDDGDERSAVVDGRAGRADKPRRRRGPSSSAATPHGGTSLNLLCLRHGIAGSVSLLCSALLSPHALVHVQRLIPSDYSTYYQFYLLRLHDTYYLIRWFQETKVLITLDWFRN